MAAKAFILDGGIQNGDQRQRTAKIAHIRLVFRRGIHIRKPHFVVSHKIRLDFGVRTDRVEERDRIDVVCPARHQKDQLAFQQGVHLRVRVVCLPDGGVFLNTQQDRLLDGVSDRIFARQIEDGVAAQITGRRQADGAVSSRTRYGYG